MNCGVGGSRRRVVVLTRGVGDSGGCVRRFWWLVAEGVCGGFKPWVHGGWVLGLGGVLDNAATKLVWRLCRRLTTIVAAGGGWKFQGNRSNRQIPQADRLTMPT